MSYEMQNKDGTASGGVVVTQPGVPPGYIAPGQNWMPIPQGVTNCPPGLEYLTSIDQLVVHQKLELMEAFTGMETENRYAICNTLGQQIYMAKEESGWCARQFCQVNRSFDLHVFDNFQQEVIHIRRPPECDGCCFRCCFQRIEVYSPPGQLVGTIKDGEGWCGSWRYEKYDITDGQDNVVLRMQWPICRCSCCSDIEYPVYSEDLSQKVGQIFKKWSGLGREMFTDADNFSVKFPIDLDVRMKAVMLGACFLIDYMYFEANN